MSEGEKESSREKEFSTEAQHDRWKKYGANVVLSSVIVIVLAGMLTWLAQGRNLRWDTTVGGTQSLRPQSVDFIKNLKEHVQIVALYPRLKSNAAEPDSFQPVADLLNEYATKGKNISTEMIDPDTQKDQFDKLVAEVTNKYGGEVKGYRQVLSDLPQQVKAVDDFATQEAAKFRALAAGTEVQDQQLQQTLYAAYLTLQLAHQQLGEMKTALDSDLEQQVPSYKDAVDDTRSTFTAISQWFGQFSEVLATFKNTPAVGKAVQDYAPGAIARAEAAKKVADAVLGGISHLPPLKELDEFRSQLKSKSIIVMTDSGYKILSHDDVWKLPQESRFASEAPDVQPKLIFAGEQQITSAIASLTGGPKPMVVFVRPGGPPLATMGMQGQAPMLAAVAQRLRDDNFDVEEKDASGQPPQEEEMEMPEPTDAQMKSAIWVVVRPPGEPPSEQPLPLDQMLSDHLKSGGSAMVLLFPMTDSMDMALEPMGIHTKPDFVIVHEALPPPPRRTYDLVDAAFQANQYVFELNNYGNHPIADPLRGLEFLGAVSEPIMATPEIPPGVKVTPLLPIPMTPHFWASADTQALFNSQQPTTVTFHPNADPDAGRIYGDIDNTAADRLYGAAAAESKDGSRLVVVGSSLFASSDLVDLPDEEMRQEHGLTVARLPGNGEFFVNSILWLAHEDAMLAISPHALQMARIEEMSPATLGIWRVGVMTIAMPLAVVLVGLMVYSQRKD